MKRYICFSLACIFSTVDTFAGTDGINTSNSQHVVINNCFACGGDDAVCIKALTSNRNTMEEDVRDIRTSNVMIYNEGFRALQFGAETTADYMEDVVYDNISIVKASLGLTMGLGYIFEERAHARFVEWHNVFIEAASGILIETDYNQIGARASDLFLKNIEMQSSSIVVRGTSVGPVERVAFANIRRNGVFASSVTGFSLQSNVYDVTLENTPFAVRLTHPIHDQKLKLGEAATLKARIVPTGAEAVASVAFYAGDELLGEDTTAPYSIEWTPENEGPVSLQVVVTGNLGGTDFSTLIPVFVYDNPKLTNLYSPAPMVYIESGSSKKLQIITLDQFNRPLDPQPAGIQWSVQSGPGTVDADGTFNASTDAHNSSSVVRAALNGIETDILVATTEQLEIINLDNFGFHSYELGVLESGALKWVDNSATYSSVPAELSGLPYIQTARDDRGLPTGFVSFELTAPAAVYLFLDEDMPPPLWVIGRFVKIGKGPAGYNLWLEARQEAGLVNLYFNSNLYTYSMYGVAVGPLVNVPPNIDKSIHQIDGLTWRFSASESTDPDGSIVHFEWDFGDGVIATGEVINHSYSSPGVYEVKLTVRDNAGTTTSTTTSLAVGPLPPVASFNVNPKAGSPPLVVNFDASASTDPNGSIVSYSWNFGDNQTATGAEVSHTYTSTGTFTAELTVVDNEGLSSSVQSTITVTDIYASPNRIALNINGSDLDATSAGGLYWNGFSGSAKPIVASDGSSSAFAVSIGDSFGFSNGVRGAQVNIVQENILFPPDVVKSFLADNFDSSRNGWWSLKISSSTPFTANLTMIASFAHNNPGEGIHTLQVNTGGTYNIASRSFEGGKTDDLDSAGGTLNGDAGRLSNVEAVAEGSDYVIEIKVGLTSAQDNAVACLNALVIDLLSNDTPPLPAMDVVANNQNGFELQIVSEQSQTVILESSTPDLQSWSILDPELSLSPGNNSIPVSTPITDPIFFRLKQ